MLKRVIIAQNTLDPSTWEDYAVEHVADFLMVQFPEWPVTARIYHNSVDVQNDITPVDDTGVGLLEILNGPFYVVVYPAGDVFDIFLGVVTGGLWTVFTLVADALTPSIPSISLRNSQQQSPNNELSNRTNTARINGRIPDIFGTVRSTPDLIAVPYKIFAAHQEVEYAYMCIGRGAYEVSDIRDDKTLCTDISGTSVEVYGPGTSPNYGTPELTIGNAIATPVLNVIRSNSVNGQVLRAPNVQYNTNDIKFNYPNEIQIDVSSSNKFQDLFVEGDEIVITGTSFAYDHDITNPSTPPDTINEHVTFNLNGTYTIGTLTDTLMMLVSPALVNSAWGTKLEEAAGPIASSTTPLIKTDTPRWVGPFTLDSTDLDYVMSNFVALNGLYKDNGQTQQRFDVIIEVELTPVDGTGAPTGSAETFQGTVEGSAVVRATRALTFISDPTFTGLCKVRARRVTDADLTYQGQVVDEVKWRDLYTVIPTTDADYGDVTTVQSVTKATAGALALKERKLNMLVTRKIPARVSGSTFTSELYASNSAADIISAMCLDTFIGNRSATEIDFNSIYDTVAAVCSYFGSTIAGEFSYTFDKDSFSFEETITAVANAVFSNAYRRGNIIKLSFEKETDDSTLLFNHRNKVPGSETRTVNFGITGDNDGIEYEYVSPTDDAIITYYLPADRSAVNPKKIESIGVRSKLHAHFQAYRIYNKLLYQNTATEFEALQEADLLVRMDRVLVADNTRPHTQDGEVIAQNMLELTLSQNVDLTVYDSYEIFLQHYDGSVESISIVAGTESNKIVLSQAPRLALVTDNSMYARTGFVIVGDEEPRQGAFLVNEKTSAGNFTSKIIAINYNSRYYQNDYDYINGVVGENGDYL